MSYPATSKGATYRIVKRHAYERTYWTVVLDTEHSNGMQVWCAPSVGWNKRNRMLAREWIVNRMAEDAREQKRD